MAELPDPLLIAFGRVAVNAAGLEAEVQAFLDACAPLVPEVAGLREFTLGRKIRQFRIRRLHAALVAHPALRGRLEAERLAAVLADCRQAWARRRPLMHAVAEPAGADAVVLRTRDGPRTYRAADLDDVADGLRAATGRVRDLRATVVAAAG